MAAAISAGELALAMSRANNSARLAGADMNKFIGYITTVADISQKSAESVGESFKTIFSRFGNVKAGKYTPTDADMSIEGYDESSFENLNDIETVLSKVGIRLRENATTWRDIDDVLTEIGQKWSSWDQTTKNAVATVTAGTRQRENVITLFENWDQVSKYAEIAENAYGTATEKMKAYSNSVEASQKRMTAAIEKLSLSLNQSWVLEKFYNALTSIIDQFWSFSGVIAGILVLLNGKSFAQSISNTVSNIGVRLVNKGDQFSNFISGFGEVSASGAMHQSVINAKMKQYSAALEKSSLQLTEEQMLRAKQLGLATMNLEAEQQGLVSKILLNAAETNDFSMAMEEIEATKLVALAKKLVGEAEYKLALQDIPEEEQATREVIAAKKVLATYLKNQTLNIGASGLQTMGGSLGGMSKVSDSRYWLTGVSSFLGSTGGFALAQGLGLGATGTALVSGAGSILPTILGTLGKFGPWLSLAAAGITAIWGGVKAIKKAQEQKEIKQAQENFTSTKQKLSDAQSLSVKMDKYDELVAGVGKFGENISLSTEDYQEFLDISNSLVDTFLDLEYYVDEQGNKIVQINGKTGKLSDTVESLTTAMQKNLDTQLLTKENGGQIYENEVAANKKDLEERQKRLDMIERSPNQYYASIGINGKKRREFTEKYNINLKDITDEEGNVDHSKIDWEGIKKTELAELRKLENDYKAEIRDVVNAQMRQVSGYSELNSETQSIIQQASNNIDLLDENGKLKEYEEYLGEIEQVTKSLIMVSQSSPDVLDTIVDTSSTADAVKEARQTLLEQIQGQFSFEDDDGILQLSEDGKRILIALGFEWDDKAKGYIDKEYDIVSKYIEKKYDEVINKAYSKEGSSIALSSYSYSDLQRAYQALGNSGSPERLLKEFDSFDSFIGYSKFDSSTLPELVQAYKTLNSQLGLSSTTAEQENAYKDELKQVESYLDKWADGLGVVKGDYDAIIEKAKVYGDVAKDGASKMSSADFLEKRTEYQELYDYIREDYSKNGGYTGEWASKIATDPELAQYMNDYQGMSNKLKEWLDNSEDAYKNTLMRELKENAAFSEAQLDQNAELYTAIMGIYNNNLDNFSTLAQAEEYIDVLKNGSFEKNALEWLQAMNIYYGANVEDFSNMATAIMQINQAMASSMSLPYDQLKGMYQTGKIKGYSGEELESYVHSELVKEQQEQITAAADAAAERIKNLSDTYKSNMNVALDTFDESGKAADRLKAKLSSLNKEWAQMQAYMGNTSALDDYYNEMDSILNKLYELKMAEYNSKGDTEEGLEALGEAKEYWVQMKNLDDERAEDAISILENQGLLNDNVIEAYRALVATADTEEERIEYEKRLNDKIKEQKELVKTLLDYQKELLDTLLEYEKYTPNSTYYMNIITRSEANLRQQMQNSADRARDAYNLLYEASYENWKGAGKGEEVAKMKAAYEASQDSDYQQAVKDYIQAYQALAQVAMDVFNDKVDALQRRLDDIEDSRANEWSSISQIKSYYESIKELQESIRDEAAEALKNIDDLTDEQVQELVDKYNEALKDINQNMIDYYSDIKDYQESIYSALGNEVGRYKEQLEEQKKIIEENYDMELQKLQDKQSSISRTNKLLEIQRGLQDATENRSRIYREGLGFVYETDRNKIKEAEQQLKDFQLQDRIDDLQNAKDAELKLLDDRISAWDEYLKALETKYSEYDRLQEQHLLKQLLNLQTQEEVTALITGDMLSFSNYSDNNQDKFLDDMIGAYMGFDTKFGTFLDDYKSNLEMLKFYNEQSLSFLDASNYNRANGAFLENVIEENLAPINPQIEYRSSGGGGVAAPQYKNADFYGSLGQYDYSRQNYTYDTGSDPEAVKKLQTTIAGIVGASTTNKNSELYILVDGKIGSQTAAYIEQILASGNASDIATLNAALSAAGVSYNPNFNYGGNTGSARDYTSYYGYTYDSGNHDVSAYGAVTSTGRSVDYANNGHDMSEVLAAQQAYNREHPNNKIAEDGKWGAETSAAFNGLSARQYFGNASGILAGPVTYTGLTMLHGTPSSPEYVLNSDQAYSLLRYMATTKPEAVAPGCGDTIYNFTGGITMNGVNDPEAFFGELMKATSNRFNVTKNRY